VALGPTTNRPPVASGVVFRAQPIVLVLSLLISACTVPFGAADDGKVPVAVSDNKLHTVDRDPGPSDIATVDGCDRKTIGEESGPLVVAYGVDDGRLSAAPCFGRPSEVVEAAWDDLSAITPAELTDGVAIVAGFTGSDDTLAYAAPVDDDSDEHLIAVAIDAAIDDPEELRLTMAHELAHVFTQTTDQIDVAVFGDECETFFNGFGCFEVDAYVTAWIDQFWPPDEIATLPADYSVDIEGGEDRCDIDPSFPGSYAASHPEEDFAESFSAFVFDVDLPASLASRLEFFADYPEFMAMRDAVRSGDEKPPPNTFDPCG
jgi:hypothetical protein